MPQRLLNMIIDQWLDIAFSENFELSESLLIVNYFWISCEGNI